MLVCQSSPMITKVVNRESRPCPLYRIVEKWASRGSLVIEVMLPPVGDLRFAPPEPFESKFNGTTSATINCIQFWSQFIESASSSEDWSALGPLSSSAKLRTLSLYLNVWVPPNASPSSKLPVKVWIYGGADDAGGVSNPLYDGCRLASGGDSVVVSVNYRFGPSCPWCSDIPDTAAALEALAPRIMLNSVCAWKRGLFAELYGCREGGIEDDDELLDGDGGDGKSFH
ncbi:alpha/beta-hydrolase [Mollisia scopiformis]|uniref:Alpha/beta-hydrolase n=1 Tax=Mollisia scopiformis TaxID=149040 RepID=A0A194XJ82_MOLSC|nr:alpha/beta-hydrolase [Mollisia scopiformis]KUJ20184.1 alpha/beta-hydrolase [Mollisia scopiformis]